MDLPTAQLIVAFIFGVVFVIVLLIFSIKFPLPTPFQYNVYRTILSLAAAGAAAMIPGFINIEVNTTTGLLIRAGGALAVFVIVFFFNPAKLAEHNASEFKPPPPPDKLPDGTPFPIEKRERFIQVWQSLLALEKAGQSLWLHVSDQTLSAFAEKRSEAQSCINDHAIFFSEEDYEALQEIMRAADFYLGGKMHLSEIRNGILYSDRLVELAGSGEKNRLVNDGVAQQIQQNKRWLTRYRNLLAKIRSSFSNSLTS